MEGFAILCVTIPPRGQVGPARPSLLVLLDFIHFYINSTNMKVDIKSNESVPGVAQDLLFQDKDIHKLKC
jgi:hypothetical protein